MLLHAISIFHNNKKIEKDMLHNYGSEAKNAEQSNTGTDINTMLTTPT